MAEQNNKHYPGYEYSRENIHGLEVLFQDITTRAIARHMERPMGRYVTIHTGRLKELDDWEPAVECLAECLRRLLTPYQDQPLLIMGLGSDCLSNSLGPEVIRNIPARLASALDTPCLFSSVSLLAPGTAWQTNTSTASVISGMIQATGAACAVLIDVCGALSFEDMSTFIHLTTGGIQPMGGGEALTQETLGVPVVIISVPLLLTIPPKTVEILHLRMDKDGVSLMDLDIERDAGAAAAILSRGILRALYPKLDLERLDKLYKMKKTRA